MPRREHLRSRISGFTLIELIITILVMSILLGIGIPSYLQFKEDNTLQGAAQALYSDIQFARSEAIKRNVNNVIVHIFQTNTNWCYQVSDNSACTSCGDLDCDIHADRILRGVSSGSTSFPGVIIDSPDSATNILIESRRSTLGTIDNQIVFSYGEGGKQVEVRTTPLGRVFICTPAGQAGLTGVDQCPSSP